MNMNAMNIVSRQVRILAGVMAMLAALCVSGGSLSLAEHYAQVGIASQTASGNLAGQPVTGSNRNA